MKTLSTDSGIPGRGLQPGWQVARLRRLTERAEDTEAVLGSDVMTLTLEGYALLKVAGRNQGLEGLRKDLSARSPRGRASWNPFLHDPLRLFVVRLPKKTASLPSRRGCVPTRAASMRL